MFPVKLLSGVLFMVNKRFIRILFFLLLLFVIAAVSMQLVFTLYLNKKIRNQIESEVLNQSGGEYEVKMNKLSVNIFNQSVRIRNFYLKTKESPGGDLPNMIVSSDEINILDFYLFRFLMGKKLMISKLELKNSSFNIYRTSSETKSRQRKLRFSIHQLFSRYFNEIGVKEIDIIDSDLKFFKEKTHTDPFIISKNNHLRILNLKNNSAIEESGSFFRSDSLYLEINRILFLTTDKLYSVSIKKLTASHADSELRIDSLQVTPNYSKKDFASKAGGQTDRFVVSAPQVRFTNINVNAFFERFWFIAGLAKIKGLVISAYRDKNEVRKPGTAPTVRKLLKKIPFYTILDSIQVENAQVTYEEVAEGAALPGTIRFNHISALLTGITTDSAFYSKYSFVELNSSSKLMNEGKLTVRMRFPLNTEEMVFHCRGRLTGFPMKAMNPMLTPAERISIKSGVVDSMIFSFDANNKESKGTMKFLYHDLRIEFLNKNEKTGIVQDFLAFLTHKFILKENNPQGEKPVRIIPIRYKRDPSRFIFNYSWKSLLSGIKPTIGIPDRTLKKEERKERNKK